MLHCHLGHRTVRGRVGVGRTHMLTLVISGRAYTFEFKHSLAIPNNSMKDSDGQLPAFSSIFVHKIGAMSLSMSCSMYVT